MTIHPPAGSLPTAQSGATLELGRCRPGSVDTDAPHGASLFGAWRDGEQFVKTAAPGRGPGRQQDLRGEFEILRRCQGIPGIPVVLDLIDDGMAQALVMERVPHAPLNCLEISWARLAATLIRLSRILWRLARRGVSHDDLRPENILVSEGGETFLVDFDQATRALSGAASRAACSGFGQAGRRSRTARSRRRASGCRRASRRA